MANIVFGSFSVAGEGEKAAAALIDRGARAEDISLVRSDSREYRGPDEIQGTPTSFDGSVYGTTSALSTPGFNDIEQPNQIVAN